MNHIPSQSLPTLAQAAPAIQACRDALRAGSSTFFVASLLLPGRVRRPASALYAFCRLADDSVDGTADKQTAVQALRQRLDALRSGNRHEDPLDLAFAAVMHHFRIPFELPGALIEGFAWDAQMRRYDDLPGLLDYAARVAGSVGAMMALVMGVRDPAALARACDLGVAMQLSNIARDVGEDARAGRLYLPLRWMREEGLDPDAWMADPVFSPALARVVARLLDAAREHYRRSLAGVRALPLDCRVGINAARRVYGAIGDQVARRGFDSVTSRAFVPGWRKLALVGAGAAHLFPRASGAELPPLPANAFLVDAVRRVDAAAERPVRGGASLAGRLDDRAAWLADLCARLSQRERVNASQPAWR